MALPLVADSSGQITGQFTIPGGNTIPAGAKLVEFAGEATQAVATFVGEGTLTTETLRVVNTQINRRLLSWHGDPLAQTFILSETEQLAAIDLWFLSWDDDLNAWVHAIGTTNVLVQIRDVNQGLPTLDVLSEALLTPLQITQQMTANGFVRFTLPPIDLDADHEYCFVVACNDAVSALAVAGVGEFDALSNTYVVAQPYQIGVLLSSSNNRTWTAHQSQDLTFRLVVAHADATNSEYKKIIDLQDVVFADPIDHLVVLAAVTRPNDECNVEFTVTTGAGGSLRTYTCAECQPISFEAPYTGTVHLQATLTGTEHSTPVLNRDITVVGAKRLEGSVYISRSMATNQGLGTVDVSVYYDAFLPSGSAVVPWIQDGEIVDVPQFIGMTAGATTDLGDGWVEYRWDVEDLHQPDTRCKLVLTGSALAIPRVKNLRMVMI